MNLASSSQKTFFDSAGGGQRRMIILVIIGVVCFVALFSILIVTTTPKHSVIHHAEVPMDNQAAVEMIESLQCSNIKSSLSATPQSSKALVTDAEQRSDAKPSIIATAVPDETSTIDETLKSAGNAAISVYQASVTQNGVSGESASQPSYPTPPSTIIQPATPTNLDTYQQQNQQGAKQDFLNNSHKSSTSVLNDDLESSSSPYEIKAGTLIPAFLLTAINSDLPGTVMAKVRGNVYDTLTGNFLLIPQGTTLLGVYDSQITYGQKRVLVAWQRLVLPNGDSVALKGQPAVDGMGASGLHDQVDNHTLRLFGSSLMYSLFSAAGQLSQPQTSTDKLTQQQILFGAIGQQLTQTGAELMAKQMNVQPTLKIRAGAAFNVLLRQDMVFPHPYHFDNVRGDGE